jgi:cytochrome c oxidase cbb3-type subunit 2
MRSNFLFFLGLFAALGISWWGIVLGSNAQLGGLAPYYDDNDGSSYPQWFPGGAARGQLVYKDLGCAACHTQQVRRPGFGSDQGRGWGDRQSVARDYIYQPFPQLGLSRIGPDLTNVGDRKPSAPDTDDFLHMLYAGSDGMPSYRFLFKTRRIGSGAQPSDDALKLTGALEPKAGWEIVPSPRAQALAAYLVNLKTTYDYPESVPVAAPKPEGAAAAKPAPAAPAAPAAGKPGPAPAPSGTAAPSASANPTTAPTTAGTPAAPPASAAAPTPAPAGAAAPATTVTPTPAATTSGTPAAAPTSAAAPAASATPTPAPGTAGTPAAAPTPAGTAASGAAATPTPAPSTAGTPASAPTAAANPPATPAPSAGNGAAPSPTGAPAATPSSSPSPTPTGTTPAPTKGATP